MVFVLHRHLATYVIISVAVQLWLTYGLLVAPCARLPLTKGPTCPLTDPPLVPYVHSSGHLNGIGSVCHDHILLPHSSIPYDDWTVVWLYLVLVCVLLTSLEEVMFFHNMPLRPSIYFISMYVLMEGKKEVPTHHDCFIIVSISFIETKPEGFLKLHQINVNGFYNILCHVKAGLKWPGPPHWYICYQKLLLLFLLYILNLDHMICFKLVKRL